MAEVTLGAKIHLKLRHCDEDSYSGTQLVKTLI